MGNEVVELWRRKRKAVMREYGENMAWMMDISTMPASPLWLKCDEAITIAFVEDMVDHWEEQMRGVQRRGRCLLVLKEHGSKRLGW